MALPQQTITKDPVQLTAVEGGKSGRPKWIGWSILGALLIAVAVLVVQVVEANPSDGSSQQVETERFNGLAPVGDNSSEAVEAVRFGLYQPATSDGSSEAAESSRMIGLSPSVNGGSSETAEHIRMIGLAS
ncbi:MAG: hypothetical protein IH943_12760 [Acidobacteria bacterium]|nr:hypothetical protein [Acidobacteriota bacterium]